MKILKLDRSPDGEIVDLNLQMTNHEIMWFVGFALNQLLRAGQVQLVDGEYKLSDQLQQFITPRDPQEV